MGFVDDQYAITEAPQPQRLVPRRQHSEQRLIDGADAHMREERLAAVVGDPGRARGAASLLVAVVRRALAPRLLQDRRCEALVQLALAVSEHERGLGSVGKQPPIALLQPLEHRVRRRHGRQREEQPIGAILSQ